MLWESRFTRVHNSFFNSWWWANQLLRHLVNQGFLWRVVMMHDAGQMIHDTWHIIHDEYVQDLHMMYIYIYICLHTWKHAYFFHRYNLTHTYKYMNTSFFIYLDPWNHQALAQTLLAVDVWIPSQRPPVGGFTPLRPGEWSNTEVDHLTPPEN